MLVEAVIQASPSGPEPPRRVMERGSRCLIMRETDQGTKADEYSRNLCDGKEDFEILVHLAVASNGCAALAHPTATSEKPGTWPGSCCFDRLYAWRVVGSGAGSPGVLGGTEGTRGIGRRGSHYMPMDVEKHVGRLWFKKLDVGTHRDKLH